MTKLPDEAHYTGCRNLSSLNRTERKVKTQNQERHHLRRIIKINHYAEMHDQFCSSIDSMGTLYRNEASEPAHELHTSALAQGLNYQSESSIHFRATISGLCFGN